MHEIILGYLLVSSDADIAIVQDLDIYHITKRLERCDPDSLLDYLWKERPEVVVEIYGTITGCILKEHPERFATSEQTVQEGQPLTARPKGVANLHPQSKSSLNLPSKFQEALPPIAHLPTENLCI